MTEITTLKQLCAELKLDPREARERVRDVVPVRRNIPKWQRRIGLAHLGNGSKGQQARRKQKQP